MDAERGIHHHIHHSVPAGDADESGLGAVAKTAIEVLGRVEPLDNLAKRAMSKVN
jgi:hypothetical protein